MRAARLLPSALLLLAPLALACGDEPPSLYLPTSYPPDAGADAGTEDAPAPFIPPPPAPVCEAGLIRCLAASTDAIEQCHIPDPDLPDATRWGRTTCPAGQVCQDGLCGPFACTPGRDSCHGLTGFGICDPAGTGLIAPQTCPDGAVCRGGQCVVPCEVAARERSYIGCDYVVLDLPNPLRNQSTPGAPFGLVIANSDPVLPATIEVRDPFGQPELILGSVDVTSAQPEPQTHTVRSVRTDADGAMTPLSGPAEHLQIPPGAIVTLLFGERTVPSGISGIHRVARRLTSSLPVVAYQFNPYCCNTTYTNDASLLLPTTAAGQDYTLLGAADMRFDPDPTSLGLGFTLVALSDDQTLTVELPAGTRLQRSLDTRLTLPPDDDDATTHLTVTLARDEVLHLESRSTTSHTSVLSGARATSNSPFVAFSTHPCTYIPQSLAACDHLEQQLIPQDTWGQTFVMAPTARRGRAATEINYWHLVAGDQPARLRLTAELLTLKLRTPFARALTDCRDHAGASPNEVELPAGAHCMLATASPFGLEASAPIMVMGYIAGQVAATANISSIATGDPAMFLLPPVEQYRDRYLFLTPATYAFDFATAIVPFNAAETLTLDGYPVDLRDPTITVLEVPGSQHLIVHIPVTDGAHTIEASTSFGLVVYAYDAFVSYAYPGGLNLSKRK